MMRVFLGLCVAVLLGGSAGVIADAQDFKLVNKTGLAIDELYLSAANDNEWGEDVLGRDILNDGEPVDITFDRAETECVWDLKIVDGEQDEVVWEDINLCKTSEITLFYKNKVATAELK